MDEISPPKRVTRARAAAKTAEPEVKTTKIATAASKAKLTRTTSTTKRKTRSDEVPEDQQASETSREPEPVKTTRGRPKKAAIEQPEREMEDAPAPVKATRGRPKKTAEEPPAPAAPRTTRGRAKKTDNVSEAVIVVEEPPKRAPRTRTGTVSKATAPKKSVKFEEPDKENIVPLPANAKTKPTEAGTGLRAKPVRKIAQTTTRATRGRAKSVEEELKNAPLSPKKATQVAKGCEPSDDELATNVKTPMKPLMKSPIKPPTSVIGVPKKLDFSNSITCNAAVVNNMAASIASPARRPPQSPFKDTFKTSPQKISLASMAGSPPKLSHTATKSAPSDASFKVSILQSPARRPQSPTKVTENGSPSRSNTQPIFGPTPKANAFKISRFATPRTVIRNIPRAGQMLPPSAPPKMSAGALQMSQTGTNMSLEPSLKFSGRLSSIMPREADPALQSPRPAVQAADLQINSESEPAGEPMILDEAETVVVQDVLDTTSPPCSPRHSDGTFELHDEQQEQLPESDSEDELAASLPRFSPMGSGFSMTGNDFASSPATPTPFQAIAKTPRRSMAPQPFEDIRAPAEKFGFTPLANQLSNWMAASPEKEDLIEPKQSLPTTSVENPHVEDGQAANLQASPEKSTYFDDAMSVHEEMHTASMARAASAEIDIDGLHGVELDERDLALAQEADEMSLLEPEQILGDHEMDDSFEQPEAALSEASQEYGDENAIPIDPKLLSMPIATEPSVFTTPKRVFTERVLHTVSKVPLKPAAEHTPMRPFPKKRSASSSRLPVQRPTNTLTRNNTVISYSPTKSSLRNEMQADGDVQMQDQNIATPSKAPVDSWSTIGTPARTPRRDLDTKLLQGAVVFVDVYTTEGADASVLFTELLTQMGARCVKNWTWNSNEEGSKVGITHVVFKDGGKRTLEKARETNGVVSCVGVGWVLDCERENKWLPESPYAVDTALVPRGGHRRRKSMEPRALANLTGALVPSCANTPARHTSYSGSPTRGFLTFHDTPVTSKSRRRESVIWERSPSSVEENNEETLLLSPVPATPAPETISAYLESYLDDVNGQQTPGGQTPYFLHTTQLVQQTAPVRKFGKENGNRFLPEKKDETVMMRLMAARRKSLQFAPKVGSPLARGGVF